MQSLRFQLVRIFSDLSRLDSKKQSLPTMVYSSGMKSVLNSNSFPQYISLFQGDKAQGNEGTQSESNPVTTTPSTTQSISVVTKTTKLLPRRLKKNAGRPSLNTEEEISTQKVGRR